jgi:DNA-binding NtrC family response regulator
MMTMGEMAGVQDLPGYLVNPSDAGTAHSAAVGGPLSLEEHERSLLADALGRSKGNQSEAARLLGIGRDALRYKMKKFNL